MSQDTPDLGKAIRAAKRNLSGLRIGKARRLWAYHGSVNKPFRHPELNYTGKGVGGSMNKLPAFFLSSDPEVAAFFSDPDRGFVGKFEVTLQRPVIAGEGLGKIQDLLKDIWLLQHTEPKGAPDSIIFPEAWDGPKPSTIYAITKPKQARLRQVVDLTL